MKKRIVSLILAAVMVFSLAACGGNPDSTTKAPETTPQTTPQTAEPAKTEPAKTDPAPTEPAPTEPVEPVQKRTVVVSDSNCATFNPVLANSAEDTFQTFTGARLYRKFPVGDGTVALKPDLAESKPEQVDADGKVWHVKMKSGLTFVNNKGEDTGIPINAHTMEFTAKMALDPIQKNRAGDNMGIYVTFANAAAYFRQTAEKPVDWATVGIKAIDDLTLELTLETPSSEINVMKAFVGYAMVPLEEKLYTSLLSADGTTTQYGTDETKTYYSGGFYCTGWVKESTITLKKNPLYANADQVKLTDVVLRYVKNYQTQVQLFEAGELDFCALDAELAFSYSESPYFVSYPSRYLTQIEINDPSAWYERTKEGELIRHEVAKEDIALPILCDLNFKNALWYAIDRVKLAALCLSTPATYIIMDTSEALEDGTLFKDTPEAKAYRESPQDAYNEAKAKEFFDKAWTDNGYKDGDKLTLHIMINSDNTEMRLTAQYLQEQLPKVFGANRFELIIQELPSAERLANMKAWRENPNSFELSLSNWSRAATDESPFNAMDVYSSSFWAKCNSSYHVEYIEKTIYLQRTDPRVATDRQYNTELAAAMEKAALENRITIPMYEKTVQYLINDDIELAVDPTMVRGFYSWLCDVDTTD